MSAHDIYEHFTNGRGTGSLDGAQQATRAEWELEDERAQMIRRQGELIRSGWQGAASDGAFGAAQPLAESALHGATMLSQAEDLLDRQSGSFHRAANSVTPVPEEPPGIDMNDPMVVFTDHDADITAYQAQVQHNMDVYRGYDGASEYNETNMPAEYSTVNHSGGNISVASGDGRPAGSGDYLEVREREPQSRYEGGGPGPHGGPGEPGRVPVGAPVSGPVPNPSPPQLTTPSDWVPPAINNPGQQLPTTFQPAPGPGQPGFVGGVPAGGGPGGGPGGGVRGPGARGGAFGGGPGGGAGGNAGPGAGAGPRGAPPGPGFNAGAVAAEEAAARRAAAGLATRGSAPGAMVGAPLGGGRGKGDEDEEHQRKVLVETDGESLFGSDELTAPQVIGDDEYEDD